MSRFPKGLLLVAVLAELMIMTVSSRTQIFSSSAEQPQRNVMIVAPALPNASGMTKKRMNPTSAKTSKKLSNEVIVVEFKTPPHPVM